MTEDELNAQQTSEAHDDLSVTTIPDQSIAVVISNAATSTDCCLDTEKLMSSNLNRDGANVDSAASMQELTANLFEFQKSGYLCDTVIVADDGQVKAHSVVLAAASPVFKQILKNSDQPLQHTVVLPGMQVVVVSIIIQFVYTGKITVTEDERGNLVKVIDAIGELGIKLHLNRDADETAASVDRQTQTTDHMNSDNNAEEGESAPQEEMITTDIPATIADCDLEQRENGDRDSTSDHSFLNDHQYSVVFPKHVPKKTLLCNLCGKVFDLNLKLRKHLTQVHGRLRKRTHASADGQLNSVLSQISSELAQSNDAVGDKHSTTVDKKKRKKQSTTDGSVCEVCGWIGNKSLSLAGHMRIHRRDENKTCKDNVRAICDVCGWVRMGSFSLSEHMRKHTGEKPFKCSQCSYAFSLKCNLQRHEILHAEVRRYLCQYCAQSFQQNALLKCHILRHHADMVGSDPSKRSRSFRCRFCSERFYRNSDVLHHMKAQHQSPLCEVCGKILCSYLLKNHKCTVARAFGCSICNVSCTSAVRLSRHMVIHGTNNISSIYKCQLCSEQFELIAALESHVSDAHSAVQPQYQCSDCNKSFVTESQLRRHMRIHTDDAITCTVCFKKFELQSTLKLHMTTHTGERPTAVNGERFVCSICGKDFRRKQLLEIHERIHTGAKPFVCNTCGRAFRQRSHLIQHFPTHTNMKPYRCTLCSKAYRQRVDLRYHCTRVHNVQIPVMRRK